MAHEIGHQFDASHSFNSNTKDCGDQRNAVTAYEVGSGSTIMAYGGVCSPQDSVPTADDYFHTGSFDEVLKYLTTGDGRNAYKITATQNKPPVIVSPSVSTTYNVPANTPFALTANAQDSSGDNLTYCWEEFDLGPAQNPTANPRDNGSSPIFRSYLPTSSPTRFFPSLQYVRNNQNVPPALLAADLISGEYLPSTSRKMQYRCTVRDSRAGGGGSNYATATVISTANTGPFMITSPNTPATYIAGESVSVSWKVANTTAAPISCANVKISFSKNNGNTFRYILAESVPNNGMATVHLPAGIVTKRGRIKVEAAGNIFYDVSDAKLTLISP